MKQVYASLLLSLIFCGTYAQDGVSTHLELIKEDISVAGREVSVQELLNDGMQLARLTIINNSPGAISISPNSFNTEIHDSSCLQENALLKSAGLFAGMFFPGCMYHYLFLHRSHEWDGWSLNTISGASFGLAPYYCFVAYKQNNAIQAAFLSDEVIIKSGTVYTTYVLLDVEDAATTEIIL